MNEDEIEKRMKERDKLVFYALWLNIPETEWELTYRMHISFISDLSWADPRGSIPLIQLTKWFGNEYILC